MNRYWGVLPRCGSRADFGLRSAPVGGADAPFASLTLWLKNGPFGMRTFGEIK